MIVRKLITMISFQVNKSGLNTAASAARRIKQALGGIERDPATGALTALVRDPAAPGPQIRACNRWPLAMFSTA